MSNYEKNFSYMLQEVDKVLDQNRTVWEGESRMVELYTLYHGKLAALLDLFVAKRELRLPYREVKKDVLGEYAEKIAQLAGFLHEISISKGMRDMTLYTNITAASLMHDTIQNCMTRSKALLDYAAQMEEDLNKYDHGAALLAEAQAQYASFRDNGLLPFDRRNRLRAVNRKIKDLLTELRKLLSDRIDRVILFFSDRDAQFYAAYKQARKVPKLGASRSSSNTTGGNGDSDQDGPLNEGSSAEANDWNEETSEGAEDEGNFEDSSDFDDTDGSGSEEAA